jgi:hypothetical protein
MRLGSASSSRLVPQYVFGPAQDLRPGRMSRWNAPGTKWKNTGWYAPPPSGYLRVCQGEACLRVSDDWLHCARSLPGIRAKTDEVSEKPPPPDQKTSPVCACAMVDSTIRSPDESRRDSQENSRAQRCRPRVPRICIALGQRRSRAELAALMRIVFPAGPLPGETDPITFTDRELEIFRNTAFRTEEMEARMTLAMMSAIEWH